MLAGRPRSVDVGCGPARKAGVDLTLWFVLELEVAVEVAAGGARAKMRSTN